MRGERERMLSRHLPGSASRQFTGQPCSSPTAQAPSATWLLTTWPSPETKRGATPTDSVPALEMTVGRTTQARGRRVCSR
ncbi:hypothetical protein GCM10018980_73370 [Streptomyces capoamus]|uniref:Uncharacterized protein n=1 Tax=Streptomyces capoamus TaxID=68183 RepID=A0A919F3K7_9ACTN|nr:hypothetical protein GCM10018980_73370 [Streptomyces capoamus]